MRFIDTATQQYLALALFDLGILPGAASMVYHSNIPRNASSHGVQNFHVALATLNQVPPRSVVVVQKRVAPDLWRQVHLLQHQARESRLEEISHRLKAVRAQEILLPSDGARVHQLRLWHVQAVAKRDAPQEAHVEVGPIVRVKDMPQVQILQHFGNEVFVVRAFPCLPRVELPQRDGAFLWAALAAMQDSAVDERDAPTPIQPPGLQIKNELPHRRGQEMLYRSRNGRQLAGLNGYDLSAAPGAEP